MELLVIRHALAQDREAFAASGQDDGLRALTRRGRKQMKQTAAVIRYLVPVIDVIATSPLTRAVQTGELLAAAYGTPGLIQLPVLAPGGHPEEVCRWLGHQPDAATLALVGHQPGLAGLIAWLTAGNNRGFARLGKGGACLLDCNAPVDGGCCEMEWLLQPRQLRMLRA